MFLLLEIDLVPAIATFLCCLFVRLELGIVIGIGINLLFLLYGSARPYIRVSKATVRFFTLLYLTLYLCSLKMSIFSLRKLMK